MGLNVKAVDYCASALCFVAGVSIMLFGGETYVAYYPSSLPSDQHKACWFVFGASLFVFSGLLCASDATEDVNTVKMLGSGFTWAWLMYNGEVESLYMQMTMLIAGVLSFFYACPEFFY